MARRECEFCADGKIRILQNDVRCQLDWSIHKLNDRCEKIKLEMVCTICGAHYFIKRVGTAQKRLKCDDCYLRLRSIKPHRKQIVIQAIQKAKCVNLNERAM